MIRYINRVGLGEKDPFACPLVEQRATPGAVILTGPRAAAPAADSVTGGH